MWDYVSGLKPQRKFEMEIAKIYTTAKERVDKQLSKVGLSDFSKSRADSTMAQIDKIIKWLYKKSNSWTDKALKASLKEGVRRANISIEQCGLAPVRWDTKTNRRAVAVLAQSTVKELEGAAMAWGNRLERYVRASQLKSINDGLLSRAIGASLVAGEDTRGITSAVYDQLKKQLEGDKFLTINGRNYDPKSYARLIARTRTREATTIGQINSAFNSAMVLVQIDVHSDACEICQQYMGRVFTLEGQHPDFPKLERTPPFHPNCECNLYPVTEGALRQRHNYLDLVKLSNNPEVRTDSLRDAREWIKSKKAMPVTGYHDFIDKTRQNKGLSTTKKSIDGAKWTKTLDISEVEDRIRQFGISRNIDLSAANPEMANSIGESLFQAKIKMGLNETYLDDFHIGTIEEEGTLGVTLSRRITTLESGDKMSASIKLDKDVFGKSIDELRKETQTLDAEAQAKLKSYLRSEKRTMNFHRKNNPDMWSLPHEEERVKLLESGKYRWVVAQTAKEPEKAITIHEYIHACSKKMINITNDDYHPLVNANEVFRFICESNGIGSELKAEFVFEHISGYAAMGGWAEALAEMGTSVILEGEEVLTPQFRKIWREWIRAMKDGSYTKNL